MMPVATPAAQPLDRCALPAGPGSELDYVHQLAIAWAWLADARDAAPCVRRVTVLRPVML